jgi:hypothetical protein
MQNERSKMDLKRKIAAENRAEHSSISLYQFMRE